MQVNVRFLENLRLEAAFDDFKVIADQPIRYKGDGSAPGPFDYFLASSALCAAYFVKLYCNTRDIPTDDIKVRQNNIIDPENRYHQDFKIEVELPDTISEKDKDGILKSIERCTVKRVIQNEPNFIIKPICVLGSEQSESLYTPEAGFDAKTMILGKDTPLEQTILEMSTLLSDLGIKIEIASWRNQIPNVWSVHVRDADSPMCFSNGKGSSKDAALCSALGEYIERISNNYFYNDYYLGKKVSQAPFVHYPTEKWFPVSSDEIPKGLMDPYLLDIYNLEGELKAQHLIDTNSGNSKRGICALPYIRESDQEIVYIPVNLIGNLFVSNGMSAGNTKYEARVQCLSEIFERAVKNEIIRDEISLPDIPKNVLNRFPSIMEGIEKLETLGFPVVIKDASLGGKFPVACVTLLNPKNGGVFASFGSHPKFEVALERSLTELLQGRSFEGMNDISPPTFNSYAVSEHNNIVDHFIDSTGIVSWKFFSAKNDYKFYEWDFSGTTEDEYHYLMNIFKTIEKEVYISDFDELGTHTCRILVPGYSEIYEPEDLIWDNHNKAIPFREDILNLHNLSQSELKDLLINLEEYELDDHNVVSELIGIAFDENSCWGQLTIGELKALTHLALKQYEDAKEHIELFLAFNESLPERRKYYQLLNILLDIEINEELDFLDYKFILTKMYGEDLLKTASESIIGQIRFFGLANTNMDLIGLDKHLKLIESYEKLQNKRNTSHFK